MMKKQKDPALLHRLLSMVNKAPSDSGDILIAKAMIENRYHLNQMSLNELSEKYYCSQASISRFIKKMGYKNYDEFRHSMDLSIYVTELNHRLDKTTRSLTSSQIRDTVYQDIMGVLQNIQTIDLNELEQVIHILLSYQRVYFIGSELSMAMTYLLQLALISMGKEAYTLYNDDYQKDILSKLESDDLLVVVSIEGRWFSHSDIGIFLKVVTGHKMLWTIGDNHFEQEAFDDIYYFGKYTDQNIGYNELMYFIMLIYRLILRYKE